MQEVLKLQVNKLIRAQENLPDSWNKDLISAFALQFLQKEYGDSLDEFDDVNPEDMMYLEKDLEQANKDFAKAHEYISNIIATNPAWLKLTLKKRQKIYEHIFNETFSYYLQLKETVPSLSSETITEKLQDKIVSAINHFGNAKTARFSAGPAETERVEKNTQLAFQLKKRKHDYVAKIIYAFMQEDSRANLIEEIIIKNETYQVYKSYELYTNIFAQVDSKFPKLMSNLLQDALDLILTGFVQIKNIESLIVEQLYEQLDLYVHNSFLSKNIINIVEKTTEIKKSSLRTEIPVWYKNMLNDVIEQEINNNELYKASDSSELFKKIYTYVRQRYNNYLEPLMLEMIKTQNTSMEQENEDPFYSVMTFKERRQEQDKIMKEFKKEINLELKSAIKAYINNYFNSLENAPSLELRQSFTLS